MLDVYTIDDLLTSAECHALVDEIREAEGAAAVVFGTQPAGSVQPLVRKVTRVSVPQATVDKVTRLLAYRMDEIGSHFGTQLERCEEPQFLHYLPGDFFVAHQDGNTPLVHDDTRFRRISIVIFLNEQIDEATPGKYSGGSLVLHGAFPDYDRRLYVPNRPGTLAAYRSETTHEVLPVISGERFTIVSWYRSGPG